MEWTRVGVEPSEDSLVGDLGFSDMKIGLDDHADDLHESFLGGFSNLSEARERHSELVSEMHPKDLSAPFSTLGELLSEFGGEWVGSEIKIPLQEATSGEVVVDTKNEEGRNLVRLMSPERFGGVMRTFALPAGSSLSGVRWEAEFLTMLIED